MSDDSIEREVVRILCILYCCGELTQMRLVITDDDDYTHTIDSENELQKIDFWLRYPDHFAAALLRRSEPGESLEIRAAEIKALIRRIFEDEEPQIRWEPMRRYLRGAHEPLDRVLRFLTSRWLVYRRLSKHPARTRYFLTSKGCQAVECMITNCPEVMWYIERCKLIASLLGDLEGLEKRALQYQESAYLNTPIRSMIPRVDDEVHQRFLERFGEPL